MLYEVITVGRLVADLARVGLGLVVALAADGRHGSLQHRTLLRAVGVVAGFAALLEGRVRVLSYNFV